MNTKHLKDGINATLSLTFGIYYNAYVIRCFIKESHRFSAAIAIVTPFLFTTGFSDVGVLASLTTGAQGFVFGIGVMALVAPTIVASRLLTAVGVGDLHL